MNVELKPCPFCGSTDIIIHFEDEDHRYGWADINMRKLKGKMFDGYCQCWACKVKTDSVGFYARKEDLKGAYHKITDAWNNRANESQAQDQSIKSDAGKPRLTLIPQQIIYDIAEVREYGCKKYGDPENWREVDIKRYFDAMYRHWLAFLKNPQSRDRESEIHHYKHCACNMAFICEMMKEGQDG